jgi:hypothetical protein
MPELVEGADAKIFENTARFPQHELFPTLRGPSARPASATLAAFGEAGDS